MVHAVPKRGSEMPDTKTPSHGRAVALALTVTFLWSSSWILIRWGLDGEDLEPLGFAGLRYGLAALVLLGATLARAPTRRALAGAGRSLGPVVLLGLVFYAVTQGAQFIAIDNQPAATTSLVLSFTPLLVAAASSRERPRPRQVAGALLVVVGAWAFFSGDLSPTSLGMTAALVGLGANTASSLLGRRINRDTELPALVVTTVSMAVGAAALLLSAWAIEGLPSISARGWAMVAWLATVNTALAFTLWNRSLQRLTALESAGINNSMLVQIAVLAWAFLGEPPGVFGLAGVVAVTAGIVLTQAGGTVVISSPRRRQSGPAR